MSNITCANDWITKVCNAFGVGPGLVTRVVVDAAPLDTIKVEITLVATEKIEKILDRVVDLPGLEVAINEH